MKNHFHLLVRMRSDSGCSNADMKKRLSEFYGKEEVFFANGHLPFFRHKLTNLSEYVRKIKLRFTRGGKAFVLATYRKVREAL